jgi:hypothetical protein
MLQHDDPVTVTEFDPLDHLAGVRLPLRCNTPCPSAWIGHVPFGMSLVSMVRPRMLVELGAHVGVSYCGFCEVVEALGLPTQCRAIDTWQGDSHTQAYGEDIFAELSAHHDPRYRSFSRLIRSTFDAALPDFEDGTVDLLHIDGYHTYEAVHHDFTTWLPKMSDRGVILLHDTAVRDKPTFGVWRLWDELKQSYPHFEFEHSFGLGVLAVGTHVPTALAGIVPATGEQADRIRQYFAGLGQMLERVQCLEMALRIAAVPKSGQSGRSSAGIAGLLAKTLSRRD